MSYKIKRLEEYIGAALAGVLHVNPHLPVLLAALVVVPVGIFIIYVEWLYCNLIVLPIVLPPREHCCQPQVKEHWAQQQPAEWEGDQGTRVTGHVADTCGTHRQHQPSLLCEAVTVAGPGLSVSLSPRLVRILRLYSAPQRITTRR